MSLTSANIIFIALCIVSFSFQRNNAQIALTPSVLSVNLGYFRLLISSNAASVNCALNQASSEADAVTIEGNPPCRTGAPPISTVWIYTNNETAFGASLRIPITTRLVQLLVVSCCSTSFSATSRIAVDIAPNVITNTSVQATDTVYPNPAFVNIAPCPCNLTDGLCDINCCCDSECTANDTALFTCLSGAFGGNFTTDPFETCWSQRFMVPDWHQFLCFQFVGTPDLGLFYGVDRNIANTATAFSSRLSENPTTYTFADSTVTAKLMPATSYQNGDPVQIQLSNTSVGHLTLPQMTLSGQCLSSASVAFQKDRSANCDVTVTEGLCDRDTVLDVGYYLTNAINIVGGPAGVIQPNPVSYLCGTATDYVKTNQNPPSVGRSLFNDGTSAAGPTSCPTAPGSPQLDGATCRNSVVKVSYLMLWNETSITAAQVEVTVADVPLTVFSSAFGTQPDNILTQSFDVTFQHATAPGTSLTFLSGNPGYVVGYPVISGTVDADGSVNTTSSQRLSVWLPGSSGLCADSTTTAPLFGQDFTSGCQLRLALTDFLNSTSCDTLRQLVESKQRELIAAATRVSRFGAPDNSSDSVDWLVLNASESLSAVGDNLSDTPGRCDDIPAQTEIVFLMSLTGRILGYPIMEIVGVDVSWTRLTWQMKCAGTQACSANDPSLVENFPVTSSVRFIKVPVIAPPAPTLAEIRDNTTCERDATCWPELASILTRAYYYTWPLDMARTEVEYNLAWTLLLVFFTAGATLLPLNWRKIGRYVKENVPL